MRIEAQTTARKKSAAKWWRALAASSLLMSASAMIVTVSAGQAAASPCGNAGSGSSLLSAYGSSGSASGSSGSSTWPAVGPQGALPVFQGNNTQTLSWVTGPRSVNSTFNRFAISGTDLGIAWDNGSGQTLMAFGDTFGDCGVSDQEWRHNTLLRSAPAGPDLSSGQIAVPNGVANDTASGSVIAPGRDNFAQQLIPSLGISQIEVTTIPTAAIEIGGVQYMNYMSVRSWGSAGNWVTNFSAVAYSTNNGQTWTTDESTIRLNSSSLLRANIALPSPLPSLIYNNGKFQQSAYVKGNDGWIYQFGTPNGRFGAAFLARFQPGDIRDLSKYEYWTGTDWTSDIAAMPDVESRVVQPGITELSVSYSPKLGKYIMLDGDVGFRLRTASQPQGPWSAPHYIVPIGALPDAYAPMILPTSPAILGTGDTLYFNASSWNNYNVMLLKTDLSKIPNL